MKDSLPVHSPVIEMIVCLRYVGLKDIAAGHKASFLLLTPCKNSSCKVTSVARRVLARGLERV
jgi:hypothetical protein